MWKLNNQIVSSREVNKIFYLIAFGALVRSKSFVCFHVTRQTRLVCKHLVTDGTFPLELFRVVSNAMDVQLVIIHSTFSVETLKEKLKMKYKNE